METPPPPSQEKVRQILVNLKTKRSGAGGNGRLPPVGKARSKNASAGNGKGKASSSVAEEEYEMVVEDVAEKLLSRLPRMPFPPTSQSTTNRTDDFDLSSTLSRISALQTQLTTNLQSAQLLRRQISREKAALKRDKKELKALEDGLRGSKEVRKWKERGLHPLARQLDRLEDADDGDERDETTEEIERMNAIAGIKLPLLNGLTGVPTTTKAPTSSGDSETDPELDPLLGQLRSHLLSMRNNTASMMPMLEGMDGTKVALDKFAARNLDEQALSRIYGVAEL